MLCCKLDILPLFKCWTQFTTDVYICFCQGLANITFTYSQHLSYMYRYCTSMTPASTKPKPFMFYTFNTHWPLHMKTFLHDNHVNVFKVISQTLQTLGPRPPGLPATPCLPGVPWKDKRLQSPTNSAPLLKWNIVVYYKSQMAQKKGCLFLVDGLNQTSDLCAKNGLHIWQSCLKCTNKLMAH